MTPLVQERLELSDTLLRLYREMDVSPVTLLTNYAHSHIHAKIQKYTAETAHFEKKYDCPFAEFKHKIDNMANEENFEWEDDALDWEFATENLAVWQQRLREIQACSSLTSSTDMPRQRPGFPADGDIRYSG